ncbi:transposase [Nitrosomonas sp. Nm166]|uniref:transposase n=1 Tax=Nitrosomonas sp. Nm166 TaxID=1881054 RepID=UPI003524721B
MLVGISFIDSTRISVRHNHRIWSHQVMADFAARGSGKDSRGLVLWVQVALGHQGPRGIAGSENHGRQC